MILEPSIGAFKCPVYKIIFNADIEQKLKKLVIKRVKASINPKVNQI